MGKGLRSDKLRRFPGESSKGSLGRKIRALRLWLVGAWRLSRVAHETLLCLPSSHGEIKIHSPSKSVSGNQLWTFYECLHPKQYRSLCNL